MSSPTALALPARRPASPPQVGGARDRRRRAVAEVRRSMVLDAAREAFAELGLERASLREIARRAGYSPGAIYSYFASKEEVYAALLGESLERLNSHVQAAAPVAGSSAARGAPTQRAQQQVRAAAAAFFEFYLAHPRELDLGFYLFGGLQPRGLTPALDRGLNARLRDALGPTQAGLLALGLRADEAVIEVTALFAHIVGVLLLNHTGRMRMFALAPRALFERYLDALVARAGRGVTRTRSAT